MLSVIGLLTSSCSPFTLVNSTVYNNSDVGEYKTFRIVAPPEGSLPPGMTMVTYYNIAAAIREQMVERGFTESAISPLMVNIALTVQKEIETAPVLPPGYFAYNGMYPYYMYPRNLYWQNYYSNAKVITGIYREGVLTMELVDTDKKIALYSSSVSTILQPGDSQFRNLSEIAEAVKTLFSDFPVKLLPQYNIQSKK
jgi:hypothetical protein